ncbi:MAG: signal transduction histidine kinase [Planctomycetota bacterium]
MRIGTHIFLQTTLLVLTGGAMTYVVSGQLSGALEARERVEDDARDLESLERLVERAETFLLMGDLVLGGGTTYLAPVAGEQAQSMNRLIGDLSQTPLGMEHGVAWERLRESTEEMGTAVTASLEVRGEDRDSALYQLLDRFDASSMELTEGLEDIRDVMRSVARLRSNEVGLEVATAESETARAILAFLAIILIAWSYLWHVLGRPIRALAEEAVAARAGEAFTAPTCGPAEVQALSESFSELVQGLEDARDGLEQTVEERTAELKAALLARSLFLANTSHELRTPMNAILGFSRQLQDEQLSARERRESIHHIQDSGEHLMDLISDLLDITSIDTGKIQLESKPYAPGRLLESLCMGFSQAAQGKRLELEMTAATDLPHELRGDGKRVRQILDLLVDNAIKFTDEGSVKLRLAWRSGELVATVQDTGIGLAPTVLKRIFEAFEQIDSSHSRKHAGTGLGLAIGRELARAMGGELSVASVEGEGCTFRLALPAEAVDQRPNLESSATALPTPTPGLRILVVDDVDLNRLLAKHILEKMDLVVEQAVDGATAIEAVEAAETANQPFDAILMDLQMPGIDGYEATERITAMGFAGPIIALSAAVMPEQQARAIDCGCSVFLSKPIDLKLLRSTMAGIGKSAA